jgi:glycosyltransferase involved in cell wall biosynthesis
MLSILILTRYDRLGASSRVRFLQFLPTLASRGMKFSVQPFLGNDYIKALYGRERIRISEALEAYVRRLRVLLSTRRYDLVWVEKEALPWLPAAAELALMSDTPYVVDFDDAWFHRYDHSPSRIVRGLMGGKIDAIMRHAAVVVVGNEYLATRARCCGARRVEIIPSVIDINRYGPAIMPHVEPLSRKRPIVIGWIGTPITAGYLLGVEEAFRAVAAERAVELHVVGARAPGAFAGLPVKNVVWSEANEIEAIRAFDIGIMPLNDTVWERGKCAYKLLQVMAACRPVVGSAVGANCSVIRDGVNGFLVDRPNRWMEALTRLIDDADLRVRMGFEAFRTITDEYAIERVLPQLASVLVDASALCGRHPSANLSHY